MKPHWIAAFLLSLLLSILSLPADTAGVKVTIQSRAPIQTLDDQGHPDAVAMSSPGAVFVLVKTNGANVVLKDASGQQYQIAASATDYLPPAPVTTATPPSVPPPVVAPPPVSTATVVSPTTPPIVTAAAAVPPPAAPPPPSDLSKDDAVTMHLLNDALGFPLIADSHFWNDSLGDVAQRLNWPKESETTNEASYRRYSSGGQSILGALAYSMALYGKKGQPTYLSIIFSNAGDFGEVKDYRGEVPPSVLDKVKNDLARAVKQDAASIDEKLSTILGQSTVTLFGNSSSNREEVHRWDWKDVSFLLNAHNGGYATLKIIPASAADDFGQVEVTDREDLKDILAKRVVKRDNGDVVISEIPMVDQGPKGYCVPATWERYLRYVDVPADLYVLALLGDTGLGGGTDTEAMRTGVNDYVSAYHRRIEVIQDPLDTFHVAKYVDQGLPLMWTCWVTELGESEINIHTQARKLLPDLSAYATAIEADDKIREGKEPQAQGTDNGHMRMIIGYNTTTNELAISDSWGRHAAERWITVKEANDISQGDLEYIQW